MSTPNPPTGRTIARELVKEMEDQLYELVYRTLPPTVFHVYLHPDDYRTVEAIAPLIVGDAARGLSARVDELNRRSRLLAFVSGRPPAIDAPAGGWEIHIQPEVNGDIAPGDFRIESRLAVPPTPAYNDGVPTVRIGRTTVSGESRHRVMTEETRVAPHSPPASAAPSLTPRLPRYAVAAAGAATTKPVTDRADDASAGFARLAYVDEQGPHVFVIRKDVVAIGRGGSAHWVDVQIVSTPRVSRVHCRIRRDGNGRFFLQDVSTWGTFVDGDRAPVYLRHDDAGVEETGAEHELPPLARIQLADAVTLEFQVLSR